MSYAAVPLYRAFCAATGFAGTPVVGTGKFSPDRLVPVSDARRIRVRFNADTSEALPWRFEPQQKYVDVLPGETSLAFYKARNAAPYDVIGIATYNVTPDRVSTFSFLLLRLRFFFCFWSCLRVENLLEETGLSHETDRTEGMPSAWSLLRTPGWRVFFDLYFDSRRCCFILFVLSLELYCFGNTRVGVYQTGTT